MIPAMKVNKAWCGNQALRINFIFPYDFFLELEKMQTFLRECRHFLLDLYGVTLT